MANYRQIHVSIWKDEWFLDLDPDEKLLFIYLFSNESASLAGIYKIALKVIAFETGLDPKFITAALDRFAQAEKVYYSDGVIWVKNLRKYNRGSSKVDIRIQNDIDEIPDCQLKQAYLSYYVIDEEIEAEDTTPIPNDKPDIPYRYDTDSISLEMNTNEMNTNESEKDNAGKPAPSPSFPLSGGQRYFLERLGAKRFKNNTQRDAVLVLEKTYGTKVLQEATDWAALKGMSLGDAIQSLQTALPKWGNKGKNKNGSRADPGEPAGYAGIRAWLSEQEESTNANST